MIDWNKKLVAWLHDPAEKALILLRDREGHERGTVSRLRKQLDISSHSFDKRADWLAAGADRPQWPRDADKKFPGWEQVVFANNPELIHPLAGTRIKPEKFNSDLGTEELKAISQSHFETLIVDGDPKQTYLNFWRFGPELARFATDLGPLWAMQPADTRVPDHTIWNHVDLVAGIHTALAGDADGPDQPALLAMSFGPVQGFISQARSTSDLWAGSHLLSTLVWEALHSIVDGIGPDAVVFPALRGVPVVDRWLMEQGSPETRKLFEGIGSDILAIKDDTNPLFAAALPNKFVAIVPARQAQALAERAIAAGQAKALALALKAAEIVFEAAGKPFNDCAREQVVTQLAGFPEAYWAAATWPVPDLEEFRAKSAVDAAASILKEALDTIHPTLRDQGVFAPAVWQTLSAAIEFDGVKFWSPSTGLLYPAVYELVDRGLAAAKAIRPFTQSKQAGHRCTLTGEYEWLTHDPSLLALNRKDREKRSVWGEVKGRFGIKAGEHLGALATLKRLWPVLFAQQIGEFLDLPDGDRVRRYVLSTHALAMSTTLERLATNGIDGQQQAALAALAMSNDQYEPVTLPHSLLRTLYKAFSSAQVRTLRRLPAMIEEASDSEDGWHLNESLKALFSETRPEAYYALIQMDGDRMGGWLAGNEAEYKQPYRASWHSKVVAGSSALEARTKPLSRYLDTLRPNSPGRHVAISQALNDFSIHLARHIVEDCCKGKLLYAGGDDVLALVAVDDLFDCMQLLRLAYSGIAPDVAMGLQDRVAAFDGRRVTAKDSSARLLMKDGFGYLLDKDRGNGRLMTLMGPKATASMGAVVAHHSAPLTMVLRELRQAEGSAKAAGRDAFCLRVLKRGGGEVSVTNRWWATADDKGRTPQTERSALGLMKRLAAMLAGTSFSRGAIFRAQLWFEGLSDEPFLDKPQEQLWRAQMAGSLAYQFERQQGSEALAREIVDFICDVAKPSKPRTAIENFLVTSEFFAREARSFQLAGRKTREQHNEEAA